jgi:hypothetical protein
MKLTKDLREQIVNHLVEQKFQTAKHALKEEEHYLADRVYKHLLGTHISVVKTLPEGYFAERSSLYFTIRTDPDGGYRSARHIDIGLRSTERMPGNLCYRVDLELNHKLTPDLLAFDDAKTALDVKERELREVLAEAIAQVNTDKALMELLPETEPFFRGLQLPDNSTALTLSFRKVKDLLAA